MHSHTTVYRTTGSIPVSPTTKKTRPTAEHVTTGLNALLIVNGSPQVSVDAALDYAAPPLNLQWQHPPFHRKVFRIQTKICRI